MSGCLRPPRATDRAVAANEVCLTQPSVGCGRVWLATARSRCPRRAPPKVPRERDPRPRDAVRWAVMRSLGAHSLIYVSPVAGAKRIRALKGSSAWTRVPRRDRALVERLAVLAPNIVEELEAGEAPARVFYWVAWGRTRTDQRRRSLLVIHLHRALPTQRGGWPSSGTSPRLGSCGARSPMRRGSAGSPSRRPTRSPMRSMPPPW